MHGRPCSSRDISAWVQTVVTHQCVAPLSGRFGRPWCLPLRVWLAAGAAAPHHGVWSACAVPASG